MDDHKLLAFSHVQGTEPRCCADETRRTRSWTARRADERIAIRQFANVCVEVAAPRNTLRYCALPAKNAQPAPAACGEPGHKVRPRTGTIPNQGQNNAPDLHQACWTSPMPR